MLWQVRPHDFEQTALVSHLIFLLLNQSPMIAEVLFRSHQQLFSLNESPKNLQSIQ